MNSDASENFFRRWARRKAESDLAARAPDADIVPTCRTPVVSAPAALPTLADVGTLAPDADFSGYLAGGLDRTVHRAAMKKLFTDPHFNVMDGLDIYIDDYNIPSPVSAAMLAGLAHARSTLDPKPAWRGDPADVLPAAPADATSAATTAIDTTAMEFAGQAQHAIPDTGATQSGPDAADPDHAEHGFVPDLPEASRPLKPADAAADRLSATGNMASYRTTQQAPRASPTTQSLSAYLPAGTGPTA